jgi:Ca2+-binding EF-hand superfamily protein
VYTKHHADDVKNPILKHLVRVLERKDGTIHFEDLFAALRTVESGDKDSQLAWLFVSELCADAKRGSRSVLLTLPSSSSASSSQSFHDLDGDGRIDKFEMLEIVKVSSV